MTRVALYSRVSTEEQAKYGFSIEAQKSELQKYAIEHNYAIVDEYVDEGVSGGKLHRPELDRMLNDVRKNKIDMILFVKLDRWFRSVSYYYKVQEVLDQYNVAWKCTQEDYETETSAGKFKVNIMLSVNQQFKDATSERIKSVFKYKNENGYYITQSVPFGYKTQKTDGGLKIVIDEEKKQIVNEVFLMLSQTNSIRKTVLTINEKYGTSFNHESMKKFITNSLYIGKYRNNDNFCEPYVSESFQNDIAQRITKAPQRKTTENRTYLLQGLIRCKECNNLFSSSMHNCRNHGKTYKYPIYKCRTHYSKGKNICGNAKQIFEVTLEKTFLKTVRAELENKLISIQFHNKNLSASSRQADLKKIENKINRLNELYIEGNIEKNKYDVKMTQYKEEIQKAKENSTIISTKEIEDILNSNFEELYTTWDRETKKAFLLNLIDYISVDKEGNTEFFFK